MPSCWRGQPPPLPGPAPQIHFFPIIFNGKQLYDVSAGGSGKAVRLHGGQRHGWRKQDQAEGGAVLGRGDTRRAPMSPLPLRPTLHRPR